MGGRFAGTVPTGGAGGGTPTGGGPGATCCGVGGRCAPVTVTEAGCAVVVMTGAATTLSCAKSVLLTIWRLCAASVLLGLASEICTAESAGQFTANIMSTRYQKEGD